MASDSAPVQRRAVRDTYPEEMPRERLIRDGPGSLKTSELIAILLRTGVVGEPVFDLSERLLRENGGLLGLQRLETRTLMQMHGLGEAKATTLKSALEIGRRLALLPLADRPAIASPEDVAQIYGIEMAALEHEQLRVVLLDTRNRIIEMRIIYQGSANEASVRIGELFRDAVRLNAVSIILMHNHPSGDPTPSGADISLTAEVVAAGKLLDIVVVDHLVFGQGRHVSLKRLGLGFPRA
ncbi:MAG TPA: DNA repair protein RadC [Thermomicrobiales bacterium]|nr:DNA repair protein RadC [Thermomicrobiales bacterium]